MKKILLHLVIAGIAFAAGFAISHNRGEQRIKNFAENIRLNEVYFTAVDDETGERVNPSVGFERRGMFNSVILPGVLQWGDSHTFRMNWIDIEGKDGYITASAGRDRYRKIDLREWSWSDRDKAGGSLDQPVEIRFSRTTAQQASDGNAEKPSGVER